MKKLVSALTGKTALYVVIALAAAASVLEVVSSVRNGTRIDWQGMAIYWVAISGWAVSLEAKEKKKN